MRSAADVQQLCEQYAAAWSRQDVVAATAIYASDAVVCDPVDGPAIEGVDSIREFFAAGVSAVRSCKLLGPVQISGDCRHAAARLEVEVDFGDGPKVLESVHVMAFQDDGRVSTMKAYWGPTNLHDT